jgi:uncharacterized membrane protein
MAEWLIFATEKAVLLIDVMALIIILFATVQAFIVGLGVMLGVAPADDRNPWLRLGRWLVVGLTFLLAADIVETSVAPSWEDIGRLAAIALIRTFLNYFLERDLLEAREIRKEVLSD